MIPRAPDMQIIPSPILAALLVIPFAVTFFALRIIIIKPLMDYMEERDRAIETAKKEAEDLARQSEERMASIREKLEKARSEIAVLRAGARTKAQEQGARIVAEARLDAEERLDDAVLRIEKARVEASAFLRDAATRISRDIVVQVLGRPASAAETR